METIIEMFEVVMQATTETRIKYMPEFLYLMKLVDVWNPEDMLNHFSFFWKIASFVNSEHYDEVYQSHDLKRNLQKRVIANPIMKILTNWLDKLTWQDLVNMNFMIKISDELMTIYRKLEIVLCLKDVEADLWKKFETDIATNPSQIDFIVLYLQKDTEEMQKICDENKPKKDSNNLEEVKKAQNSPKKKSQSQENETELTDEELEKFGLIPEFRSRSKLIKFFRKKNITKLQKYIDGVYSIVNSIHNHGYEISKIFFLNPVECTWFSQYVPPDPKSLSSSQEIITENGSTEECKVGQKKARTAAIQQTVHHWNESKIKINDLQNFIFQNTKYLLLNYPEYGKNIEDIELKLIDIHKLSTDMIESK